MTWVCQGHIGDVLCYPSSHHHGSVENWVPSILQYYFPFIYMGGFFVFVMGERVVLPFPFVNFGVENIGAQIDPN